ncbi:MAG: MNIO family bufferin maturase [Vicinamibacterales bacterium]
MSLTGATTDAFTGSLLGRAGVGLRLPHLAEVVATRPPVAWFEIHPENFLASPHARELLAEVARHYAISVHTVGISIGSTEGVDRTHLARLRALLDTLDPVLVSGHLAWSTHQGAYLNDLLPLPYDADTLTVVATHLAEVQDALGRPYLVENPSSYVGFGTSTMTEAEFLCELVRRTGCSLLCDVSNVHLSAHNMGYDAYQFIDALPVHAVRELHLGGFTPEADAAGPDCEVLIDTHAASVAEPVWDLYAHAVRRFGHQPTLIEWDNDIPPFATLAAEAARADRVARAVEKELRAFAG